MIVVCHVVYLFFFWSLCRLSLGLRVSSNSFHICHCVVIFMSLLTIFFNKSGLYPFDIKI